MNCEAEAYIVVARETWNRLDELQRRRFVEFNHECGRKELHEAGFDCCNAGVFEMPHAVKIWQFGIRNRECDSQCDGCRADSSHQNSAQSNKPNSESRLRNQGIYD